jgi:hypothetical protein
MIRKDSPPDDMMSELHLLRACIALRDEHPQIEDLLPAKPVFPAPRG